VRVYDVHRVSFIVVCHAVCHVTMCTHGVTHLSLSTQRSLLNDLETNAEQVISEMFIQHFLYSKVWRGWL
jgi:hypothetical protein